MSALVPIQAEFLLHVTKLLAFAYDRGYLVTLGEGFRTLEQQKLYYDRGLSRTMDSQHRKRLAVDLFFFQNGKQTYIYPELGIYWESLHPKNRWGGHFKNFQDVPHFERIE